MTNTSLLGKVIDFLSKPINTTIIAALFFTSAFIFSFNFLPEEILKRMNLLNFLNEYNYIVFIALVGSFFILVIQGISRIFERRKDRAFGNYYKEQQEKLFNDPDAYHYLEVLYEYHPNHVLLPYYNQKVRLLEQFGLIVRTTNTWHTDMRMPSAPYVLQPIAEERLKKDK